jgi:hypothetical protein
MSIDEGRIKEFTVMVRPQSAVHALGEADNRALAAGRIQTASAVPQPPT